MRPRLFNLAAAASLVLCVAMLGLVWMPTYRWHCAASYWTYVSDAAYGFRHNGTCEVRLVDGHY